MNQGFLVGCGLVSAVVGAVVGSASCTGPRASSGPSEGPVSVEPRISEVTAVNANGRLDRHCVRASAKSEVGILRHELARAFEIEMTRLLIEIETSRGGNVDPFVVSEVASIVGRCVLEHAETHETEVEVCMRVDRTLEALDARLEDAAPAYVEGVRTIREQAHRLFNDSELSEYESPAGHRRPKVRG